MDHDKLPTLRTMPRSPPSSGSMSNDTRMNMQVMQMSLYWGKDVVILFKDWPNGKLGIYILALVVVFVFAAILEVLSMTPVVNPAGTNPIVGGLTQASIYALRMSLAYLLMLSVMSYNLGVFIFAVVGHALGFFLVKSRAIAQANAKTLPTL